MKAALQYFFCGVLLIPALPILYWHGSRVRKNIPRLGEAEEPSGRVEMYTEQRGRKINVLMLGESTFAGVGVDRHADGIAGALAGCLAKEFEASVDWQVVARSGYTVKKVTTKLLPNYTGGTPDIVIVGVGGNDAFNLQNPITWRLEVRKLIKQLHKKFPNVPVLFAAVPPIREFPAFTKLMQNILGGLVEMLGEVLAQEVHKHPDVWMQRPHVVVQDWLGRVDADLSVEDFFSDGVHPAPLTYRLWGESLGKFISEERILPRQDSVG